MNRTYFDAQIVAADAKKVAYDAAKVIADQAAVDSKAAVDEKAKAIRFFNDILSLSTCATLF